MTLQISNRRPLFEAVAVAITAAGKFVFMDVLGWKLPFILITLLAWSMYTYARWKSQPAILRYWGFRADNFRSVLHRLLPFALIALLACMVTGYLRNSLNLTWHIFPILILYPIWGTMQQFLCVGLVAGNLQDMKPSLNKNLIILITAVLFSLLHYPNLWLMLGTFVLASLYTLLYLRERNVYALGLFHGWLGAVFYYTVVGRDPFMEVFGRLW